MSYPCPGQEIESPCSGIIPGGIRIASNGIDWRSKAGSGQQDKLGSCKQSMVSGAKTMKWVEICIAGDEGERLDGGAGIPSTGLKTPSTAAPFDGRCPQTALHDGRRTRPKDDDDNKVVVVLAALSAPPSSNLILIITVIRNAANLHQNRLP